MQYKMSFGMTKICIWQIISLSVAHKVLDNDDIILAIDGVPIDNDETSNCLLVDIAYFSLCLIVVCCSFFLFEMSRLVSADCFLWRKTSGLILLTWFLWRKPVKSLNYSWEGREKHKKIINLKMVIHCFLSKLFTYIGSQHFV